MKRYIVIACLILAALPLSGQYYHSKKGDDYYSIRWYESSFSEYVAGMKAGEASSALRVIRAYMFEKGTPRDMKKAISIMEQWAEKDAGICFFATAFYDPYFAGESYSWYDQEKKLKFLHPGYVYGIRPVSAKDVNMQTDMTKALKYSEKLEKKFNVINEYSLTLRERNRENTMTDKIELLSLTEGSRYHERFLNAVNYCKSVEDLDRLIAVDKKSRYNYFDYYREFGYDDDIGKALAAKYLELFEPYLAARNGDLEAARKDLDADPKMAGVRDYLAPIYVKVLCYGNSESGIKWAMEKVPYGELVEPHRINWSRKQLGTLLTSGTTDWKAYEKVFSSPIFVETGGEAPFDANLIEENLKLPEKPKTKLYSNSFESYGSSMRDVLDEMDRINQDVIKKDNGYRNQKEGKMSTIKADYTPLIDRLKQIQILNMRYDETVSVSLSSGAEIKYPFESYLAQIAKGKEKVNNRHLKYVCNVLEQHINTLGNDYPDNKTAQKEIRNKKQYVQFAELLLAETDGHVGVQDYLACNFRSESLKQYVEGKLDNFRQKRLDAENAIANLTIFSKDDIKRYESFMSSARKAKRSDPELLESVRDNVIQKAIDECKKAEEIYPAAPISNVHKRFLEEDEVIEIALDYASGKNVEEACALFMKFFPESACTQLITDYSNDSYALRQAAGLNAQSTKEDIKQVLDLPMTKDAQKQIKKLVKKLK